MDKDRTLVIFFIFIVFLLNNTNLSGKAFDISNRFCKDSDNGISPDTPGFVEADIGTFNDRCLIGEVYVPYASVVGPRKMSIREYYCIEGRYGGRYQVASRVIECKEACEKDVSGKSDACVTT